MQQTLQNTAVWGELVKLPCNCGKIQEWHRLFDGVLNIKWKPFRQFWQARLTIYLHKFWFFIQLIIFGVLPWYIYAMPSVVIVQTWLLNHFLYMCFLIVSSTSKMQGTRNSTPNQGPWPHAFLWLCWLASKFYNEAISTINPDNQSVYKTWDRVTSQSQHSRVFHKISFIWSLFRAKLPVVVFTK